MCKNVIGIIRNLEIKFRDENYYNYINITFIYITVLFIIFKRSISFLTILKLLKISGLQTKIAFKQRFKYKKMNIKKKKKINFIKVILKL